MTPPYVLPHSGRTFLKNNKTWPFDSSLRSSLRVIRFAIADNPTLNWLAMSELRASGANRMAEGEGFEPSEPCGSSDFKSDAIDHSAIPPRIV